MKSAHPSHSLRYAPGVHRFVKFIANETPTIKLCANCKQHKPIESFYRSGNNTRGSTYCRECTKSRTRKWKADQTHSDDVGSVASTQCPVCAVQFDTTEALTTHLREQHVVQPGRKNRTSKVGKVIGLDVIPCLICSALRAKHLDGHLSKKHGLTPEQYLAQFPHALLHPFRSDDLGGGRLKSGERRKLGRALLNETGAACAHCGQIPEDMDLHLRRKHRISSQDVHCGYVGPNGSLVESILKLRQNDDAYWCWLSSVPRLYFIQAGPPDRPIKVGFSNSIYKRLRPYQTHLPDRIVLLLSYEAKDSDEYDLHRRFAHLNIRREWFLPEVELLEFIHERAQLKAQLGK